MLISDKQELRRCVKQAVRRAQVSETMLCFDAQQGEMGVEPLMASLRQGQGTPFGEDGAAVYAAMEALGLPARDRASAVSMQQSYERNAWLREVLDVMRAQSVLVAVPLERAPSKLLCPGNSLVQKHLPGKRFRRDLRVILRRGKPLAKPPILCYTILCLPEWRNGRRDGLKIRWQRCRVGSSPTSGTT